MFKREGEWGVWLKAHVTEVRCYGHPVDMVVEGREWHRDKSK